MNRQIDHNAFNGDIPTLIGYLLYLKHMHLNNNNMHIGYRYRSDSAENHDKVHLLPFRCS